MNLNDKFKIWNHRELYARSCFEWRVNNFCGLSKEINFSLTGEEFDFSNSKWHFEIYPNGVSSADTTGIITLYVHRACSASENSEVTWTAGIKKSDGSVYKFDLNKTEFVQTKSYRFDLFKTPELQDLKEFLNPDGSIIICCNVQIDKSCPQMLFLENSTNQDLINLLLPGDTCDVIFKVKDQEFNAHRSILATRSKVFHNMFSQNTVENESGIISIEDCDPDVFPNFLFYLYTGLLDHVMSDNSLSLCHLADKYDLNELKTACSKYFHLELSVDTFCDAVRIPSLQNDLDFMKKATNFFVNNWKEIMETPNWKTLAVSNSSLISLFLLKLIN